MLLVWSLRATKKNTQQESSFVSLPFTSEDKCGKLTLPDVSVYDRSSAYRENLLVLSALLHKFSKKIIWRSARLVSLSFASDANCGE